MKQGIKVLKDLKTNKVLFFENGNQIYPESVSGNIYFFANGENILL